MQVLSQKDKIRELKKFSVKKKVFLFMNLEILFQLTALFFILAAGPLVIVLLASRNGNL
jgi:hypothetical protein